MCRYILQQRGPRLPLLQAEEHREVHHRHHQHEAAQPGAEAAGGAVYSLVTILRAHSNYLELTTHYFPPGV